MRSTFDDQIHSQDSDQYTNRLFGFHKGEERTPSTPVQPPNPIHKSVVWFHTKVRSVLLQPSGFTIKVHPQASTLKVHHQASPSGFTLTTSHLHSKPQLKTQHTPTTIMQSQCAPSQLPGSECLYESLSFKSLIQSSTIPSFSFTSDLSSASPRFRFSLF